MPKKKEVKGHLWEDVYQFAYIGRKVIHQETGTPGIVVIKQCSSDYIPQDDDLFGIAWQAQDGSYDFSTAHQANSAVKWSDLKNWITDSFEVPESWNPVPPELKYRTIAYQQNNWHPLPESELLAINKRIADERGEAYIVALGKGPAGMKGVFRQATKELEAARAYIAELEAQRGSAAAGGKRGTPGKQRSPAVAEAQGSVVGAVAALSRALALAKDDIEDEGLEQEVIRRAKGRPSGAAAATAAAAKEEEAAATSNGVGNLPVASPGGKGAATPASAGKKAGAAAAAAAASKTPPKVPAAVSPGKQGRRAAAAAPAAAPAAAGEGAAAEGLPAKRGPGRPPKNAPAPSPLAAAAAAAEGEGTAQEQPVKRGPGRPPKNAPAPSPLAAAAEGEGTAQEQPVKRGRGRPPKNAPPPSRLAALAAAAEVEDAAPGSAGTPPPAARGRGAAAAGAGGRGGKQRAASPSASPSPQPSPSRSPAKPKARATGEAPIGGALAIAALGRVKAGPAAAAGASSGGGGGRKRAAEAAPAGGGRQGKSRKAASADEEEFADKDTEEESMGEEEDEGGSSSGAKPKGRRGRPPKKVEDHADEEEESGDEEEDEEEEGGDVVQGITGRMYPSRLTLVAGDRPLVEWKDDPDSYADVDFLVEWIVDEVGDAKNKPHKVLVKWKGFELDPEGWEPAGAGSDLSNNVQYLAWRKRARKPTYFNAVAPAAALSAFKNHFKKGGKKGK